MKLLKVIKENIPAITAAGAIGLIFIFNKILEPTLAISLVGVIAAVIVLFAALVKKPENALFLMAFFLPFERIPSVELGGMSLKINHIITLISFMALITTGVVGKRKIKSDPIFVIILLLIADLAISVTYAFNVDRALKVFLFMCLMALAYFVAKAMINSRPTITYVLRGIIAGASVVALLGVYQFLGDMAGLPPEITLLKVGYDSSTFGFARVQGASQEPLYFANYIFIPLMILFSLLLGGKLQKIVPKWYGIALIVLLCLNFVLAISRGAFLAAGLVGVLLVVIKYKQILRAKVMIPAIGLFLLIVVGVYLFLARSEPRAIEEFVGHLLVNDRTTGESVVSRLDAVGRAKELFLSRPLLGVGIGNYGPLTQTEFDAYGNPIGGWFIVNNEYMEILAENGVVGLFIFILLIITVSYYAIKAIRSSDDWIKYSLEGSLFALWAILFQYITFSTLYIFHLWFLIAFIAGQSAYILDKRNEV